MLKSLFLQEKKKHLRLQMPPYQALRLQMILLGDEASTADLSPPEICEHLSKAVGVDGKPGKANNVEPISVTLKEDAK